VQLVAAGVLRDVIDRGKSLDRVLESESERLQAERRARLRELCYGGCRYYALLNGILGQLLSRPVRSKERVVHFLLVIGLYQLEFLRIPDHAAVDETVASLNAGRLSWARGLVNGVLREYIRLRGSDRLVEIHEALTPAERASVSEYLFAAIQRSWPQHAEAICAASIARPPMTLRVNRQKITRDLYLERLAGCQFGAEATVDSPDGVTLNQPAMVFDLPMFDQGWVSVQDESAQLCTGLLRLEPDAVVLDACAAPGGKTCAMLEAMPSIRMTALDLPERVAAIHENLQRIGLEAEVRDCGLPIQDVDGDWPGDREWQRILLDVPCSGSGIIRRHPDILHRRQEGDLAQFADQQLALINSAWPLLAKGGLMLYCTCSILAEENDDVIGRFMETCSDGKILPISQVPGIDTRYGRQRLPGVHPGDGFFYCLIGKL